MDYKVVFDITEAGYRSWTFPALGFAGVVVGAVLVAARKHFPGVWHKHPRASSTFAFSFLGFATFWTAATFLGTYAEYSSLRTARETNHASVVEGVVTDFKPMPWGGHTDEKICVQKVCFQYSDYTITSGFNNTSSHGGPIREGLPVRVSYVENSIVKLEVAK